MEKIDPNLSRGMIPGYENGCYEPAKNYDHSEFKNHTFEDPRRRDNRISIRISGSDMELLHRLSLAEGMPSQSLLANMVHKYLNGLPLDMPAKLSEGDHLTQKSRPIPVNELFS
jgi:predicted DNA binding CopG/RHH family protein